MGQTQEEGFVPTDTGWEPPAVPADEGGICPACRCPFQPSQRFCRECGAEIADQIGVEQTLQLTIPAEAQGMSCSSWIAMVLFVFIILPIVLESLYGRRHRHEHSREKACYANMRVIMGAVEMYNMDNKVMLDSLDDSVLKRLVSSQYLKTSIQKPEIACEYGSQGDLSKSGVIKCDCHGTVEGR